MTDIPTPTPSQAHEREAADSRAREELARLIWNATREAAPHPSYYPLWHDLGERSRKATYAAADAILASDLWNRRIGTAPGAEGLARWIVEQNPAETQPVLRALWSKVMAKAKAALALDRALATDVSEPSTGDNFGHVYTYDEHGRAATVDGVPCYGAPSTSAVDEEEVPWTNSLQDAWNEWSAYHE